MLLLVWTSVWYECTKSNLLPTMKRPLMWVQTVSILCTRLSISADVVQFVFTHMSVDGRLVADGAMAPRVAVLQRRVQQGSDTQTLRCVMMYTVRVVATLLPNMLIWSFTSVFHPSFFLLSTHSSDLYSFTCFFLPHFVASFFLLHLFLHLFYFLGFFRPPYFPFFLTTLWYLNVFSFLTILPSILPSQFTLSFSFLPSFLLIPSVID